LSATGVCLELFIAWLNQTFARRFRIEPRGGDAHVLVDGSIRIAVQVRLLIGPTEDSYWLAAQARLEEQLAAAVPVPLTLWLPTGAHLAAGEPATSDFIDHVRKAALKLSPRERSFVPLPIILLLRKNVDSGGVVSVTGGLNPHWARFTEHVRGTYDLDSTQLHRLPESEEHLQELIDTIIERAAKLETGQIAEIETIDAWTIQRLDGQQGVTLIGVPPAETQDLGLTVRRNFRRLLNKAAVAPQEVEAELGALVVVGPYARIEQEGATTAMRGYDPAVYAGLDFVCLVADGLVKPLIQAPAARLP
jgi:hypothetical protein